MVGGARVEDLPAPARTSASPRYMPGLDGVRAVAILGVLLFHLGPGRLDASRFLADLRAR